MKSKHEHVLARPERGEGSSESGVVLIVCVAMIAVLSFIAGTTLSTLRPEIEGAGNYRDARKAFYNAEAGAQYGIDSISRDLAAGTLALTEEVETVSYSAPSGYDFDTITSLHRLADMSSYSMTVTGRCKRARAVIEVSFQRPAVFSAGVFGDELLRLQPHIELYSYDSRITISPTVASSTGDANVGSNGNIIVRPGVVLDGVFMLGEDEFGMSPSPISGYENQFVGPIPDDPLGVNTGMLSKTFAYYSDPANNDNATTVDAGGGGGIVDNVLYLGPNESTTIAGGQYYLESICIGPDSSLELDATADDPVVFYLSGEADFMPQSSIVVSSGKPTAFYLFSNSSENIKLYPQNDFMGMIYAPEAYVDLQPHNTARGVFFAKKLVVLPWAESFLDTALLSKFRAPYVEIFQWRHVIE